MVANVVLFIGQIHFRSIKKYVTMTHAEHMRYGYNHSEKIRTSDKCEKYKTYTQQYQLQAGRNVTLKRQHFDSRRIGFCIVTLFPHRLA